MAGSGVTVTATSSVAMLGDVRAGSPGPRLPEDHDLRHPEVKTLRQFARALVPAR